MREDLAARLRQARARRAAQHRVRVRRTVTARDGMRVQVDGRWLLDACGNDYLGLARDPRVAAALREAAHAPGGIASHLVCGHAREHDALERAVAEWLECPRALLVGSGFAGNLAVVQGLVGAGDACVQDRLNHASLIDAARLSGATLKRYPHGDSEGARRQLATLPGSAALLATDGVFSMDGDIAPLRALAAVARDAGAWLHVDDAHGVGVLGPHGRGSVADAGLDVRDVPLRLVTLGKALGTVGALVAGDADAIGHLAETARAYVYTTALPPALAAAALRGVELARDGDELRARLHAHVERFRTRARRHGLALADSATPIQPVPCGDDARALAMAAHVEAAGIWIAAIRAPTVPDGQARLRVTLSAAHADAEVDAIADALARARDALG